MPLTDEQVSQRLKDERNLWLATVRANGAPHLVPIWFVAVDGAVYLCTGPDSVKVRNLRANPRIAFALEDGTSPVIFEGTARVLEIADAPPGIAPAFKAKYDWDILTDTEYTVIVEISPARRIGW
jgi:PPOX class probable F420-dependent enzyme